MEKTIRKPTFKEVLAVTTLELDNGLFLMLKELVL